MVVEPRLGYALVGCCDTPPIVHALAVAAIRYFRAMRWANYCAAPFLFCAICKVTAIRRYAPAAAVLRALGRVAAMAVSTSAISGSVV